jgi:hypothetical protein
MMNRDKWMSVAGNLLPVLGVLLFGWDAAPAIFVLWLDTFLRNVQFIVTLASVINLSTVKSRVTSYRQRKGVSAPRRFGKLTSFVLYIPAVPLAAVTVIMLAWLFLCVVAAAVFLSLPALGIGLLLYTQLEPHYPAGVLTTVFAAPGMGLWVILNLSARLIQTVAAAVDAASGRQRRESFSASAPEQYLLLYNRCAVLEFLIWISIWLGQIGMILFLALASAFVSYVDTRENWLADLKAKGAMWRSARAAASQNAPQDL